MNDPILACQDEQRRHIVREHKKNGLDYLEVSNDQLTLTVHLLAAAPANLTLENIRLTGGRRASAQDIHLINFELCEQGEHSEQDTDDCFMLTVDRPGDFSNYTLSVIQLDAEGKAHPFPGFDQRYYQLDFTFKANCPSELDCKTPIVCPTPAHLKPDIDYLAKDYASFRQLMLDRLAQTMPDWKERHVPDLGIALIETLAYVGDHLSYYQDAVATEAYLATARQRISVRRHARLVDYLVHEGCNARAWVTVEMSQDQALEAAQLQFVTKLPNAPVPGVIIKPEDLEPLPANSYEVFLPLFWNAGNSAADQAKLIHFYQDHNRIRFYTWDDHECCLPAGAISATLYGQLANENQNSFPTEQARQSQGAPRLRLKEGDVLIFEEVIGPKTGDLDDANPSRRHAVRLTKVEPGFDALHDPPKPIVEIAWAQEDALPFPLCLSAIGPAPECRRIENISVARGNVVLVDHGRRVHDKPLGKVAVKSRNIRCKKAERPEDTVIEPETFRPVLQEAPLTYSQPITAAQTSAKDLIANDPGQALPQIGLEGFCSAPGGVVKISWTPVLDLFESLRFDCHFVVEMDNEGRGHLRFGDNELGRKPEAGTSFKASYRIGNGLAGNVGAEAIVHAVYPGLEGLELTPRNPLSAQSGVEPQPMAEVKLFAPSAFRKKLERAVTAEDYARLAGQHPRVQRAAAALRWTGSWYEVLVAIDPFGQVEAEQALLDEIAEYLFRFRRMGHDLRVARAQYVPLDIAMIVCVLPGYLRGHVKAALLEVFGNGPAAAGLSEGHKGFFHPDNLTFGQSIRLSKLVALAQAVPGVESVSVTRLERLFEGPNQEIDNGILPLGLLEIARLDNDPSFPENGRLELDMRGGR